MVGLSMVLCATELSTATVGDAGNAAGDAEDGVLVPSATAPQGSQPKWAQPPEPAAPGNVFYGWNQVSVYEKTPIAADDWVCTNARPITAIRWWGSFPPWREASPPPVLPDAFHLAIWTDVAAVPGVEPFSHPGRVVWETHCIDFRFQFVGWDYDPRTRTYDACFEFEQTLAPGEWFVQEPGPTGTNIYWLSIAAVYANGMPELYPWGWKTRPRDPASPAPDDGVIILDPTAPHVGMQYVAGERLYWPDPEHSWDLAFELISRYSSPAGKWEQVPDLSPLGMDVNASVEPAPPFLLADDFLCTSTGPVTDISVWGSWRYDQFPQDPSNVTMTLSVHDDIPAKESPTGYSMPGATRWMHTFEPGEFTVSQVTVDLVEGWMDPPDLYEFPGDTMCFRYDFHLDSTNAFVQEGDPDRPVVYWLDVQAKPAVTGEPCFFGWKTCITNWNDDAVWVYGVEPGPLELPWKELRYPLGHERAGQSVDLAFRIAGPGEVIDELKWSQVPMPFEPQDIYNGWNEPSVYGSEWIVADDWACTNAAPVTDVHWWGSFLGWNEPEPPQLPDAFHIGIWTDVPAGEDQPFSHPGQMIWETVCREFTFEFAGWDLDPRDPTAPLEACYRFEQLLPEEQWFRQEPANGTNIYWISIGAMYPAGIIPPHPWGWKSRPHRADSLAPDDAVRIFDPTAPVPGVVYTLGEPIEFQEASWDMAFVLTTQEVAEKEDFGDAPRPYPTLLPNGAHHTIVPGILMGNLIDGETNGLPHPQALGDDQDNQADEDGVTFNTPLIPGQPAMVTVVASLQGAVLNAWIDFGADGSWAEAGDQIIVNQVTV
ncbi:MAG: hypothetical protein JXQ71_06905, partial [Verrucomicrobia bacterium]|nr:hypothetical protein [Verrucomicrobiota bacterium]